MSWFSPSTWVLGLVSHPSSLIQSDYTFLQSQGTQSILSNYLNVPNFKRYPVVSDSILGEIICPDSL